MPDNQWQKYEHAYRLRSLKYADGKNLNSVGNTKDWLGILGWPFKKLEHKTFLFLTPAAATAFT